MTKDMVLADLDKMRSERFSRCDELNHLNGQIAYAEHVLKSFDAPAVEPVKDSKKPKK